jgi:hypothetical protein
MAIFTEEVKSYSALVRTTVGDQKANVNLVTEKYSFYITFYKDGLTPPVPTSPIIGGRQHVYLHVCFDQYQGIIDLLRNEKPIYAFYRDDVKLGYVGTSTEPVGEAE